MFGMSSAPTVKPLLPVPGSTVWPFRLGDRVRDKISGIEGTAMSRFFHMTGCDRFAIELDPKDGTIPDALHFDANRLELVENGEHPERHRNEVPDQYNIHLGDIVEATHLGMKGVVSGVHVPLYGATQFDVQPRYDEKKKELPDGYFIDGAFLTVITPYTPVQTAASKPAAPAPSQPLKEKGGVTSKSRGLNAR